MKKVISLLTILMPIVANAAVNLYPDYYRCPDGYSTVDEYFMKYMPGVCMTPYTCLNGFADSCLVDNPTDNCWLYLNPGTYTEPDGTMFTIGGLSGLFVCPQSGGTDIADYGVTRCVNLPKDSSCFPATSGGNNIPDSVLKCNEDVEVQTVGVCSTTSASSSNTTDIMLVYNPSGTYCWCRILSPFVSEWVYTSRKYSSASECRKQCGTTCSAYLSSGSGSYATFKKNMLTVYR